MNAAGLDLWTLTRKRPQIDPGDLAAAVQTQVQDEALDYRTRLLVHDSVEALRSFWGQPRLDDWLAACPQRPRIEAICCERFEEIGFPSLRSRLMEKTDPEDIRQYLEELGQQLSRPQRIFVGGSASLMLGGYVDRYTEDIDVVDGVPDEIRGKHDLLEKLAQRYGLHLGHFQSHYLPTGWEARVHSIAPFGKLQVFLVDRYDVFIRKLFSHREKDRDDLRVLKPQFDKDVLVQKLNDHAQGLLGTPRLLRLAQDNWQILFGEPLRT